MVTNISNFVPKEFALLSQSLVKTLSSLSMCSLKVLVRVDNDVN